MMQMVTMLIIYVYDCGVSLRLLQFIYSLAFRVKPSLSHSAFSLLRETSDFLARQRPILIEFNATMLTREGEIEGK